MIKELKKLKEEYEATHPSCNGVHLTADSAKKIRWELHNLYGQDPGEGLTTLFGIEVLSTNSPDIKFEE